MSSQQTGALLLKCLILVVLQSMDNSVIQKQEVQPRKAFGYVPTSALPNHNIYVSHCNSLLQGNIRPNPRGRDKLYAENLTHPASENYPTNLPLQSSISWPTYMIAYLQMIGQRYLPFSTILTHQLSPTCNQVCSVYPLVQQPIVQQMPVESMIQHPLQIFIQQLSQCSVSGAHVPSEDLLPNSYVSGTVGSLPRLNNSEVASGGKGISTLHGVEEVRFFLLRHRVTRTLLPLSSFLAMRQGSQKNGDLGDPAVNMAVSGYISQSQNVFSNPESTCYSNNFLV